jgi:hypothetical protein
MAYNIRDHKGYLIASIDNALAQKVIANVPGFFCDMIVAGAKKTVYQITEDQVFSFAGIDFYLWEGHKLIPK